MLFIAETRWAKCLWLQQFYFVPKEPHPNFYQYSSLDRPAAMGWVMSATVARMSTRPAATIEIIFSRT
jgi:hypothetical protein